MYVGVAVWLLSKIAYHIIRSGGSPLYGIMRCLQLLKIARIVYLCLHQMLKYGE